MSDIDWPLALLLAVVFVVMSLLRWRYFMSPRRRWNRPKPGPAPTTPEHAEHDER